ncbi:MAG: hypothetical protein GY754_43015 [bacterium]|nr:hypothetical protein [bacterium]
MRLAIISDTHLGDSMSILFYRDGDGAIQEGPGYVNFQEKIRAFAGKKELDYLVLLGDILDFSITSYEQAYSIGKAFFARLKKDKIAREIIYIPGNHDFALWHTVEHQVNTINRIKKGKDPRPFKMSLPGIIDDREESQKTGLTLPGVTVRKTRKGGSSHPKYGGLFLDNITSPHTPFNFVYPNLYIIDDTGSILITHGQYLEGFWTIIGERVMKIVRKDLKDNKGKSISPDTLTLKEMTALNFPQCEFASSGIGQSGPLTGAIQEVMHQVKDKDFKKVKVYLDRIYNEINLLQDILGKSMRKFSRFAGYLGSFLGYILDFFIEKIFYPVGKKWILGILSRADDTRYSKVFLTQEKVRERFLNFFTATANEIYQLNEYGHHIPIPSKMIFGHTHQPIPWGSEEAKINPPQLSGETLYMYNTGGWLNKKNSAGKLEFGGAEIFFYETGKGFTSVSIDHQPE